MKGGQLGTWVMIYVYLRLGPISWTFFRSLVLWPFDNLWSALLSLLFHAMNASIPHSVHTIAMFVLMHWCCMTVTFQYFALLQTWESIAAICCVLWHCICLFGATLSTGWRYFADPGCWVRQHNVFDWLVKRYQLVPNQWSKVSY